MPAYSFEALQADGQTCRGVLEADTARGARSQLRARGLVPLEVHSVDTSAPAGGSWRLALRRPVLAGISLALWTRQLAELVSAGFPLERALSALLTDEAQPPPQRDLVAALRAEVNAGASFARALAQFPREFAPLYIAVVAAGEQTGRLGTVLERLADDLEAREALRARLIGAALYPAIVSAVAVAIVVFLMAYVMPQIAQVFVGTRRALPWLTVAMLALSAAVRSYGLLLLVLLAAAGVALRLALRQPAARQRFDAAWLNLPLVGRLARGYNTARFAATLALLAGAGVPILKALQSAAETLGNQAMRADALDAINLVREGAPLASALAQKRRFAGLLPLFARLGEQSGQLPALLQRAATQLSADVQRRALQLATVLEPLLILAMGGVVLVIVLAVLLPIIQMNQWVR